LQDLTLSSWLLVGKCTYEEYFQFLEQLEEKQKIH